MINSNRRRWARSAALGALLVPLTACAVGDEPDAAEQSSNVTSEDRVCGGEQTVDGIDVSYYQEAIDWERVAATSTKFAIMRVGYGSRTKDTRFDEYWKGAGEAGLIRGLYQFYRPQQDPAAQAQLLIDALVDDPLGPDDLPPVLDVESTDGVSSAKIRQRIQIWLDLVEEATGKRPMIYAASMMQNVLRDDFADYPLWVANYTRHCPKLPYGWDSWRFWQYTETGRVSGIRGNVDRNVFNGTYDELRAFARGPAGAPRTASF